MEMDEITSILQTYKNKSANQRQDQLLLQPFAHICKTSGKKIPMKLLHALNYWFNISADKLCSISEIIDMLHNLSLLIDDIQDNSTYRQGAPVAHSVYGIASTFNASTHVFCRIIEKILSLGHPEATKVFIEEMHVMNRGQGIDIYWRDNFQIPTDLEYKLMAVQKLGSFYSLVARLIQLFSTKTIDVSKLIVIIGMYSQIWDDYHNLSLDITEGKFGFPIIHAIHQKDSNSNEILDILKQRTTDIEAINGCISRMQALGSLQYTDDVLKSLDKAAREEVAKLGYNPLMDNFLKKFRSDAPIPISI